MELSKAGVYYLNGALIDKDDFEKTSFNTLTKLVNNDSAFNERVLKKIKDGGNNALYKTAGMKGTMAYRALQAHNTIKENDEESKTQSFLKIKFDALISHDITYVSIIQSARASGLTHFPLPYILTNCHNSLCAVGGTINEDDHLFGLSCAKKYGGVFVPANQAVIHQYAREQLATVGGAILGSDSHTRYGALGCIGIGEGGGELTKQLLSHTYDIAFPRVIAIYLTGQVVEGVGPQDVALSIIKEVFKTGYVKNAVMEFIGPGIASLSMDFRIGVDVMTTETTCLSSIWGTDDKTYEYYRVHKRSECYKRLSPLNASYYDGAITVDLSSIRPMIAFPFHPSNAYTIEEVNANLQEILRKVENDINEKVALQVEKNKITYSLTNKIRGNKLYVEQGIVAGCAGGSYENLSAVADILKGEDIGCNKFTMSVYPASLPIYDALLDNGALKSLINSGIVIKPCFCGPCFGAGDTPANSALSVRHSTRNFPNREGSKIQDGQLSTVALMDARSIAATARNKGVLTPATSFIKDSILHPYFFNSSIYEKRVYNGINKSIPDTPLEFGPNIKDWPAIPSLSSDILIKIASLLLDSVTTTDELIPSGETSSYRSNPLLLSRYTLSRRDPEYVNRALNVKEKRTEIKSEVDKVSAIFSNKYKTLDGKESIDRIKNAQLASAIYAVKPGDGSAREQAASCQRVLGGLCNIAKEYATKRYRSNLINWGLLPFIYNSSDLLPFSLNDYLFIPNIKEAIIKGSECIKCYVINLNGVINECNLSLPALTKDERDIIISGCLINYYKENKVN